MQKGFPPAVAHTPQSEAVRAYRDYIGLSPLTPPHQLNADMLDSIHNRLDTSPRPNHIMAAGWACIELAHIRDLHNDKPAVASLFETAGTAASDALAAIDEHGTADPDYIETQYRGLLLDNYIEFFREQGPLRWPADTDIAKADMYTHIQETVLNPLITDYEYWRDETGGTGLDFSHIKGVLGEVVVLQALNRLNNMLDAHDWTVVPASTRENYRNGSRVKGEQAKVSVFDAKIIFRDQRFLPMQVKWRGADEKASAYDDRVAMVSAYVPQSTHPLKAAKAMRSEIAGDKLGHDKQRHIDRLTAHILQEVGQKDAQGTSVFRPQDPRRAVTDQLLADFRDKSTELFVA